MDGWREWMERGIEALRAGRSPEAADAFQRAADLNSTSIDALLCMALAVWQQHSPGSVSPENDALAAQVEAAFQRALGLDPRNWAGCVLFGRHLANERRFDEARVMFQRALDIEPDNADVWSALGSIRFEEWVAGGKPASAAPEIIREFQRAVSLDQLDDAAMEYIGLVLRETGDRDASARSMPPQTQGPRVYREPLRTGPSEPLPRAGALPC